jgi:integrase
MKRQATPKVERTWQMPIVPEAYDKSPLTPHEQEVMAIAARLRGSARGVSGLHYAKKELLRFQEPIFAVMALRTQDRAMYQKIRRLLYREMVRRGTSFWEWSKEEWIETICPTNKDFVRTYGRVGGRQSLMDIAYLLCGMTDLREVDQKRECVETARYIFGSGVIEQELKRITDILVGQQGRGYSSGHFSVQNLRQALCWLFLLSRIPYLEYLSEDHLQIAQQGSYALKQHFIEKIRIALSEMGIVEAARKEITIRDRSIETTGIADEWVTWAQVWFKRHPKVTSRVHEAYAIILMVGRWLATTHPGITSPEQWDEDLAIEYINYVCTSAKVGDYVSVRGMKYLNKERVGKPLAPRTMEARIAALRRFFTDLQDRPHAVGKVPSHKIERRFTPGMIFDLPSSVKRLIQPDPRDIDEVIWCKLTYAAATLTDGDASPLWWRYPLSYYRAAALLWVTSARRPNEIMRLRTGCIRRDWDPEMLDEQGVPFPEQDARLCYLQIPSNKTKGPYWVPIPKYTADAVEAWERERPTNQPKHVDAKDNALVDFLFCLRDQRMGGKFINGSLIRLLCMRAGVPEHDAR